MTFALSNGVDASVIVPGLLSSHQTRVKASVYSHNFPTGVNIAPDIVSCNTSKTIKGTGKLNITMNASRNYLNLIFPNDMINLYFQHDSSVGWIRTFFGYVDRIEESYAVSETGVPTTTYVLVCSGWEKALDKTQVYFNPALALRPDFEGSDFGTLNVGGLTLMSKGIQATGTPADIVINLIMLHLGFGSQWTLPGSVHPVVPSSLLQKRQELVTGLLLQAVENSFSGDILERTRNAISSGDLARTTLIQTPTQTSVADSPVEGSSTDTVDTSTQQVDALASAIESLLQLPPGSSRQASGLGYQSAIIMYLQNARANTTNAALLDLVNLTDYIERLAIDGFITDAAIWEKQGSLLNIVRSQTNEFVNEFFLDLRPALDAQDQESTDDGPAPVSDNWSTVPDEFNGNTTSEGGSVGPRYEPAVVMREYPFSTVTKVDVSHISSGIENSHLGVYYLGALFSHEPNKAGRHYVSIPTIHPAYRTQGQTALPDRAYKHLDVAVIHEQEIRNSRLGRSDEDHFNLFEATTADPLGNSVRYMMVGLLPIITPIHIMRHGLRVRSVTSRFSLYDLSTAAVSVQPSTEEPAAETADSTDETFSTDLGIPVGADPSLRFFNGGNGDYGYRARPDKTSWTYHNGIDIKGAEGVVPVLAIADGLVVASAPSGTPGVSGYGNTIVVYHPQFTGPSGQKIYSLYAHLSDRVVGSGQNIRTAAAAFAEGHHPRGRRFIPIRVNKGDTLGHIGKTLGTVSDPGRSFQTTKAAHLHFEIDFQWAPKNKARTPDVPYTAVSSSSSEETVISYVQTTLGKPGNNSTKNMDPVIFFSNNGVNLVQAIRDAAGSSAEEDSANLESDEGTSETESSPSRENAEEHTNEAETVRSAAATQIRSNVDSLTSRNQLARWSIMNDHWYQHNLEYLSGTITMRGAPEIRVGYRLDIVERNMSFYVEGVQHTWTYPNEMTTTLQVTRGQPNNPYPAYVLPPASGTNSSVMRRKGSRLAVSAIVADPVAVRKSISLINKDLYESDGIEASSVSPDNPDNWSSDVYDFEETPILDIVPAETTSSSTINEDDLTSSEEAQTRVDQLLLEANLIDATDVTSSISLTQVTNPEGT